MAAFDPALDPDDPKLSPHRIDAEEALRLWSGGAARLLDLRKAPARAASGRAIAGAPWRDPATLDAAATVAEDARPIFVFCVHGHEVSQSACEALRAAGGDVRFVSGGFDALVSAGASTEPAPAESGSATDSAPTAEPGGLAGMWVKIGLLSFGGPAGQIAMMQTEVVDRRNLMPQDTFLRGLNFSMLLPGPEAQQLATWLGWRLGGLAGGLFAGLAFILPGAALMIALSWAAATYGDTPWVRWIFAGVQPVVVAIVCQALLKIGGKALTGPAQVALAVAAFVAVYFLGAPFPLVVAAAAAIGLALPQSSGSGPDVAAPDVSPIFALKMIGAFAAVIVAVVFATRAAMGANPFDEVAELFLSAAFVTFGGAYAVLPYVADRAVETYQWLTPAEMLNGLAMAESTPGPLILVNVYAGYFAGWTAEGGGASLAILTAALACFYTFAPSFMLILAAAPYVERLQNLATARRALAGVSAAVVGVIANLAVYLGVAALAPEGAAGPLGLDLVRTGVAVAAFALGAAFGASMPILVGLGALVGVVFGALGVL